MRGFRFEVSARYSCKIVHEKEPPCRGGYTPLQHRCSPGQLDTINGLIWKLGS